MCSLARWSRPFEETRQRSSCRCPRHCCHHCRYTLIEARGIGAISGKWTKRRKSLAELSARTSRVPETGMKRERSFWREKNSERCSYRPTELSPKSQEVTTRGSSTVWLEAETFCLPRLARRAWTAKQHHQKHQKHLTPALASLESEISLNKVSPAVKLSVRSMLARRHRLTNCDKLMHSRSLRRSLRRTVPNSPRGFP